MPLNIEKSRDVWEKYVYARDNGHLNFVQKANQCESYFYGDQWNPIHKRRLESQGKPVLVINKVFSTLITVMGEQLQNQATVGFLPKASGTPETAEALNKIYIHIMNDNDIKNQESELFDEGVIGSRAFYDVRMDFDDSMKGEVNISLLNSKNVIIDPDADSYDPDDWGEVYVTKWMSPNDIRMMYNDKDAADLKLKARSDFNYGIDSVASLHNTFAGLQQYAPAATTGVADKDVRRYIRVVERQFRVVRRVEHFVDLETGDTRRVPEDWDPARIAGVAEKYGLGIIKKKVKDIRWTVVADNYVLHDEWSPYQHFTPVPFFPIFHKGKTIGLVENLISPQEYLNKTTSQELHVVNTTANSGWQMEENQLVNMDADELEQRGAETGLVLVRKEGSAPLEKINPNQVPTGLDRISFKADEHIKEISGVSDSQRGMDRADVAAKAIQAKQAAGGVNQAKVMFNLARTRALLAKRVLSIVQEFYTEERLIRITGGGLNDESEELTVNQVSPEGEIANDLTIGEYQVVITDMPARDNYEESQFQEAVQLRELGIAVPDAVLVEHSHLNRKEEIAASIKEAQGGGETTEAEQQAQQLELEIRQLELEEKKVGIMQKQADATYTAARARKTEAEAQQVGNNSENLIKMEQLRGELQLKREELAAELALKKEELDATLAIKRQESRFNLQLKQAESEEMLKIKKTEAANKPKPAAKTGAKK
jgi:hypothetical protein